MTHSWSTNIYWLILHQWLQTRGNNKRGELFNFNTFWLNIRLSERSRTSVAVEPTESIHCSLTTQSTTYLMLRCSDKCLIFVQVFLFKYNEILASIIKYYETSYVWSSFENKINKIILIPLDLILIFFLWLSCVHWNHRPIVIFKHGINFICIEWSELKGTQLKNGSIFYLKQKLHYNTLYVGNWLAFNIYKWLGKSEQHSHTAVQ